MTVNAGTGDVRAELTWNSDADEAVCRWRFQSWSKRFVLNAFHAPCSISKAKGRKSLMQVLWWSQAWRRIRSCEALFESTGSNPSRESAHSCKTAKRLQQVVRPTPYSVLPRSKDMRRAMLRTPKEWRFPKRTEPIIYESCLDWINDDGLIIQAYFYGLAFFHLVRRQQYVFEGLTNALLDGPAGRHGRQGEE